MTLPAGRYRTLYNIRLEDDDVLVSDGPFEILYSRRCGGKEQHKWRHKEDPRDFYGVAMDVFITEGATLKIIREGEEVRSYE